ncbi:MAG: pilus assembly protein [Candidatus Methanomethylicus sp.]|nr:pilus assembly protein [Candidatus Methanomethylicus sp.]
MKGLTGKKAKREIFAQSMVEFALVLPILLLVIIGLFEFGRLIFIYSTVVTAAREAARYGSSSNWNADVTRRDYEGQFRDCAGIRARAQNVDFFNVIEDGDILIQYDHGPTSPGTGPIPNYPAPFAFCPPAATLDFNNLYDDRIIVQVSADFTPMMGIVPMPSFTISSVSARTLLGMIVLDSFVPQREFYSQSFVSLNRDLKTPFSGFLISPGQ